MIDDGAGNMFEVSTLPDGKVQVVASGVDGNVTFTLDQQGRIVSGSVPDGSTLNVSYNADGSAEISGMVLIEGQLRPYSGTIPPGTATTAKSLSAAQGNDPLIVCVVVDAFCSLLPDIIDHLIASVWDEIKTQISLPLFLQPLEDVIFGQSFPTQFEVVNNFARQAVRERFPVIVQLEGFCTVWELLDLDDFCDQA